MCDFPRCNMDKCDIDEGCNETNPLPVCKTVYETNTTCQLDFNMTQNINCDQSAVSSTYFIVTLYIMYLTIFFIALIGNGLVCYVVHSSPRMRTVTNIFIVNLAVGDILMTILCVPFSFVSIYQQHWPFGKTLCPTVSFSQAVSVLVSAYTLVAISVDRYMAIMWPLKPRMSKRVAKLIIITVWLIAIVTALPIAITTRLEQPTHWHLFCEKLVCQEHWPNGNHRYYYSMTLMILQYVIPLVVLIVTYTSIAVVVWGKRTPGEAENCRDQRMARSKRKMIKMMVTVVVVFTICWLPYNVLLIVWDMDPSLSSWSLLPFFWFAFHWLAMSHTCYNPVIYCWMNARFRAGFFAVLNFLPRHYNPAASVHNDHSGLQRYNTTTTYISTRRETSVKSYSMSDRHFPKMINNKLESFQEDEL